MCMCVCARVCTLTVTSAQDFIAKNNKKNVKKKKKKQQAGTGDAR